MGGKKVVVVVLLQHIHIQLEIKINRTIKSGPRAGKNNEMKVKNIRTRQTLETVKDKKNT